MVMTSLVTNTSCLCISVLKFRKMMTSDGITDEAFVFEGYSKWKHKYLVTNVTGFEKRCLPHTQQQDTLFTIKQ